MGKKVDIKLTKDWGVHEKGKVFNLRPAFARELQDIRKVGKIIGPDQDKVEPAAKAMATKAAKPKTAKK